MDGKAPEIEHPKRGTWRKRLLLGCGLPALGAIAAVTAILVWAFHEPSSVGVTIQSDAALRVGEQTRIQVDIRNNDSVAHTLTSVVLDDAYLSGLKLETMEPKYESAHHGLANPIQIYMLKLEIPAGTTRQLTLVAKGRSPGQYESDFGLFFDGGISSLSRKLRSVVLEEAASKR